MRVEIIPIYVERTDEEHELLMVHRLAEHPPSHVMLVGIHNPLLYNATIAFNTSEVQTAGEDANVHQNAQDAPIMVARVVEFDSTSGITMVQNSPTVTTSSPHIISALPVEVEDASIMEVMVVESHGSDHIPTVQSSPTATSPSPASTATSPSPESQIATHPSPDIVTALEPEDTLILEAPIMEFHSADDIVVQDSLTLTPPTPDVQESQTMTPVHQVNGALQTVTHPSPDIVAALEPEDIPILEAPVMEFRSTDEIVVQESSTLLPPTPDVQQTTTPVHQDNGTSPRKHMSAQHKFPLSSSSQVDLLAIPNSDV